MELDDPGYCRRAIRAGAVLRFHCRPDLKATVGPNPTRQQIAAAAEKYADVVVSQYERETQAQARNTHE